MTVRDGRVTVGEALSDGWGHTCVIVVPAVRIQALGSRPRKGETAKKRGWGCVRSLVVVLEDPPFSQLLCTLPGKAPFSRRWGLGFHP